MYSESGTNNVWIDISTPGTGRLTYSGDHTDVVVFASNPSSAYRDVSIEGYAPSSNWYLNGATATRNMWSYDSVPEYYVNVSGWNVSIQVNASWCTHLKPLPENPGVPAGFYTPATAPTTTTEMVEVPNPDYVDPTTYDDAARIGEDYSKLESRDADNDGSVSGAELDGLAIWVDDGDGILEDDEIQTLEDQAISSLSTTENGGVMSSTAKTDLEATGEVSYSLEGADAAFFQIDAATGELSWAEGFSPDHEQPLDDGADNIYDVTIVRNVLDTAGDCLCEPEREDVQINVNDIPVVAVADAITVAESEAEGDIDGNVLENDLGETGEAYDGSVETVNGEDDSISETVTGSNGGTIEIHADGSFDFSANDDFEYLDEGEMATTTFTYGIEGGVENSITVNVEGENDISLNLAILMQSSATMFAQGDGQNFVPDWADYNGDGVANQQIDLAYLAVDSLLNGAFAEADLAGYNLNVGLISFEDGRGERPAIEINAQSDVASALDAKADDDASADYGAAFANAEVFFGETASPDDVNVVFFLGNGQQSGAWQSEKDSLESAYNIEATDSFLVDLIIDATDPNFVNLSQMDDDGFTTLIFSDDPGFGFGVAQDALSITEFLV